MPCCTPCTKPMCDPVPNGRGSPPSGTRACAQRQRCSCSASAVLVLDGGDPLTVTAGALGDRIGEHEHEYEQEHEQEQE